MNARAFLQEATEKRASDIYIVDGKQITLKIKGRLVPYGDSPVDASTTLQILKEIYAMAGDRNFANLDNGDDDFAIGIDGIGRFRVNAYMQKGTYASVIRTIPLEIPDPVKLDIPEVIINLANYQRGIVLFTGTTGSGKSTSLACLVDKINKERENHIVTIEDPMEFRHPHKKSVLSQRELEADTETYATALRAAMRQAPDVILVGEMRDHETMSAAITAAETGHLVFSTLHTIGASATVDRIIDVFPGDQQNQIRSQLSITLQAVVSQQLIPSEDGGIVAAFEIMVVNSAIRNLIREGKIFQIDNVLQTSAAQGMRTMDMSIYELYRQRKISRENALQYSVNQQVMEQRLSGQAR